MPKRILLVDDDPNIQETAKDILEDAGYQVHSAGTIDEALKSLEGASADLAIIDLNLPDGSGMELAMKAQVFRPGIAILLMTGEAHVDLGAAKPFIRALLTKPVDPTHLIDMIRRNS